jgi:hypothetical protein
MMENWGCFRFIVVGLVLVVIGLGLFLAVVRVAFWGFAGLL